MIALELKDHLVLIAGTRGFLAAQTAVETFCKAE
jgi:hypothetical protein